MSFKKEQKKYNKEVLKTGKAAVQYQRNALDLINKYTTGYADRTDFWTNKLNNRQLNLLSDQYLAKNANMLRGSAAFGSNSALNRQIENNAYDQQNYLANVANKNVELANSLQNNELQALGNAEKTYQGSVAMGANAAQNVDALNWDWLKSIGKGMQTVGQAGMSSGNPWAMAIGAAVNQTGGTIDAMVSDTTSLTQGQRNDVISNVDTFKEALTRMKTDNVSGNTLSNFMGSNQSSLGGIGNFGLNTKAQMPTFKGFGKF